jgi:hypothetical protein
MDNKVIITSCKFGYYLSNVLKFILEKENFHVNIQEDVSMNTDDLHIILFSQKIKVFPKNYIIYQLEQKDISNWINKKYELSLLFSKRCWDYSNANINKFHPLIQQKMKLFRIPIIPMHQITHIKDQTNFDILFYGTMNEPRRMILQYIQKIIGTRYTFRFIQNVFEEKLFEQIQACKIVLNIHFYENALLESYRISEVQSCRKLVISFLPNLDDKDNFNYYKESVVFVNSIDNMIKSIDYYMNNQDKYDEKINKIKIIEDTNFIHDLL